MMKLNAAAVAPPHHYFPQMASPLQQHRMMMPIIPPRPQQQQQPTSFLRRSFATKTLIPQHPPPSFTTKTLIPPNPPRSRFITPRPPPSPATVGMGPTSIYCMRNGEVVKLPLSSLPPLSYPRRTIFPKYMTKAFTAMKGAAKASDENETYEKEKQERRRALMSSLESSKKKVEDFLKEKKERRPVKMLSKKKEEEFLKEKRKKKVEEFLKEKRRSNRIEPAADKDILQDLGPSPLFPAMEGPTKASDEVNETEQKVVQKGIREGLVTGACKKLMKVISWWFGS